MNFQEKLNKAIAKSNSLVCVGLDTVFDKIPEKYRVGNNPLFTFNEHIIDETSQFVSVYKPNSAFYEAYGKEGIRQLKLTCDYIRQEYGIPIILDAKRGDIGSTNDGYVKYAFDYLGADAITLHPYLGSEALIPFLDMKDKGCIVLCKTSNPGSGELQDLVVEGEPIYRLIARKVSNEWNKNGNCMLVVGATYPEELSEVRKIVGEMTLLIPGIGSQGGEVEKTVKAGINKEKKGIMVSSSRSIIYADDPQNEANKLREAINTYR